MSKPVLYIHVDYEAWKEVERQMKEFRETTHTTTGGFYHKSIRLKLPDITIEFHGPNVGGYGHQEERDITIEFHGPNVGGAGKAITP